MAIQDNVNSDQFKQLPMFMSANEIHKSHSLNEGDRDWPADATGYFRPETDKQVWNRKYKESTKMSANGDPRNAYDEHDYPEGTSLKDHLVAHGVDKPVHLETPSTDPSAYRVIFGGHHRIAVMTRHRPNDLMPVQFHSDIYEAQRTPGYR